MRVDDIGRYVAGVGDATLSVNGVVPEAVRGVLAGGAGFLRPGVIGYQRQVSGEHYRIEALDLETGHTWTLRDVGANLLRFDGMGRWASWRPDEGVVAFDASGLETGRWPLARLLDYDDGTLVLCPSQATGRGIELMRDGRVVQTIATGELGSDATQGPNVRLRRGVLAYQADGVWHLVGGPQPYRAPGWPVYLVPVPLTDGRVAVLERDDTRLYLRWPDDPERGLLLSESGAQFGADAVQVDGDVVVVWSAGALERPEQQPEELQRVTVRVSDIGIHALRPPMPDIRVEPFSRPCWLIPFWATRTITRDDGERETASVECAGHAEVVSNGSDASQRAVRRPVVCGLGEILSVDDLLAVWTDLSASTYQVDRALAHARHVPLIAYHDAHSLYPLDRLAELRAGFDWVGIMAYCDPGESVEAFRRRVHGQLAHVSGRGFPVALIAQWFDRNGKETDLAKLSTLQGLWREFVDAYPDVIALMPFAVLRQGGAQTHMFLRHWLEAYGAAMVAPARPSRVDPPVSVPPEAPPVPVPPSTPPPPATPPVYDPLPFLRAIYLELLRREPDEYGLGYYGARLIDGRMSEADVRDDILRSPEYRALHAPPALTGLAGFRQASEEAATELKESDR